MQRKRRSREQRTEQLELTTTDPLVVLVRLGQPVLLYTTLVDADEQTRSVTDPYSVSRLVSRINM